MLKIYILKFFGIASIGYVLAFSVESVVDQKVRIYLEAEEGEISGSSMERIDIPEASGNQAMRAQGAHKNSNGYAEYSIEVPTTGPYSFWGRFFWENACTNTFFISINDSQKIRIGNDPVTDQWHWVSLEKKIILKGGTNNIKIWNDEDDAIIDAFMITSDNNFIPTGMNNISQNKLMDFNDNFDLGVLDFVNTANWEIVSDRNDSTNKRLFMKPFHSSEEESLTLDLPKNSNAFLNLSVKAIKNAEFRIMLKNKFSEEIQLVKVSGIKLISPTRPAEGTSPTTELVTDSYSRISISKILNTVVAKMNGRVLDTLLLDHDYDYVQISSSTGNIYFDNLTLRSDLHQDLFETFHFQGSKITEHIPENVQDYIDRLKSRRITYQSLSGSWVFENQSGFESLMSNPLDTATDSRLIFGHDLWYDLDMRLAISPLLSSEVGVLFHYQDSLNYDEFSISRFHGQYVARLTQVENGISNLVGSTEVEELNYGSGFWYAFHLEQVGDELAIYWDDQLLFSHDGFINSGKVGLYSAGVSLFDDIEIHRTADRSPSTSGFSRQYSFTQEEGVSRDLSEWKPSTLDVIVPYKSDKGFKYNFPIIYKSIGDQVELTLKRAMNKPITFSYSNKRVPNDVKLFFDIKGIGNTDFVRFTFDNHSMTLSNEHGMVDQFVLDQEGEHQNVRLSLNGDLYNVYIDSLILVESHFDKDIINYSLSFGYKGIGSATIPLPSLELKEIK